MVFVRDSGNPLITRSMIPSLEGGLEDPTSVFNPGATIWEAKVALMLRVQARSRETHLVMADSRDGLEGLRFRVRAERVRFDGIQAVRERVFHVYDPRLTRIGREVFCMLALDVDRACRLGVARSHNLRDFEFLGLTSGEDVRNGVLFPERVGGRYLRLERPNRAEPGGHWQARDSMVLAASEDLVGWERIGVVARGRPHYWDELIGSGPPPVRTQHGWLHFYHGIATHFATSNIYQMGALLLDYKDPTKVVARSRHNLLEPREPYELCGQVPNVVFPTGLVADTLDDEGTVPDQARLRIYYGAADTCVASASATVAGVLAALDDPGALG